MFQERMKIRQPRLAIALGALIAAASQLAAPPKAAAVQNLFVSVNGASNGNVNSGSGVTGNSIIEYAGGVGSPIVYGNVQTPMGLGFDSNGNLFVGNNNNPTSLWEIPPGGLPAGEPAVELSTGGTYSYGLTVGQNNSVYVARDYAAAGVGNGHVQVTSSPYTSYSTFATVVGEFALATDPSGNIWVSSGSGNGTSNVQKFSPSNGAVPIQTVGTGFLTEPLGIAFDSGGDLFVSDLSAGDILKFSAGTYAETVFAAGLSNPLGLAVDSSGDVYVSLFNSSGAVLEYAPNGTLLNTLSGLTYPTFITLSPVVPEPAMWLLATLGAGGLWFARRPRKCGTVE